MNGINDGLIEDSLNKYSKNKLRLYNAGYCRFGRNLDFLLCKEFSKNNTLKKIFVEVRADESTTSHPMFAFLANSREILQGIHALNGKITSEIYNHSLMNLNYLRCELNLEKKEKNKYKLELHGYNNIDRVMEKELLEEFYKEELNKNKTIDKDALEYHYSRFYLSRIKKLCDKKNIELNFIFAVGGRALGAVSDYVAKGADGQVEVAERYGPLLDIVRWLLPDLSRLDWRAWPMYGLPPDMPAMSLALLMAAAYTMAMVGLAVHAFSRREFS